MRHCNFDDHRYCRQLPGFGVSVRRCGCPLYAVLRSALLKANDAAGVRSLVLLGLDHWRAIPRSVILDHGATVRNISRRKRYLRRIA